MIQLTSHEHEALTSLRRAGSEGLPLGGGVSAGAAIRLDLAGYANLTPGGDAQRVTITPAGRAFLLRTAT